MMLKFFFGGYFEEERPLCHCHFTLVYPYFIVKGKNRSKTKSVEVGTQFRDLLYPYFVPQNHFAILVVNLKFLIN